MPRKDSQGTYTLWSTSLSGIEKLRNRKKGQYLFTVMTNTHTLVQEVNSTNVDSILQTATSLLTGPSTTTIDVNLKDENGHTALHVLIMGIKKENEDQIVTVMTFLLKHMADPNIQDNRGMTVLHLLTNGLDELLDGGIDILPTLVTLFLNHDAKPSVQNKIKMTPLHLLVARLTKKNKGDITDCDITSGTCG